MSAHDEDRSHTTSPFRPHHAKWLTSSSQFQSWELRTRSYISSFEGYERQLLDPNVDVDETRQEHILCFLIQIVHEEEGFSKLRAIAGSSMVGTRTPARRGHQAWECLRNHYHQVGSVRLMVLQNEFKKPQQPHETGSIFVTRLVNTRLGIFECGEIVSDNMLKNYILSGLRDEYQPYVSSIYDQVMERSIDDFQASVIQACTRLELRMKERAGAQSTSSHSSSMSNGFGYQQPRITRKVPYPEAINDMSLLEKFQAFLSAYATQDVEPSRKELARHMNSVSRQQFPRHEGNPRIICHGCGQPGHIKARCPNKTVVSKGVYYRDQDHIKRHGVQRYDDYSNGHQNFTPHHNHYHGKVTSSSSHDMGYAINHDEHEDDHNCYERRIPDEDSQAAIESGHVSAVIAEDKLKTSRLWDHNANEIERPRPGPLICNQGHAEPCLEMVEALTCVLDCDEERSNEEVEEEDHLRKDDEGLSGIEEVEIHDGHEEEEAEEEMATQPATQHDTEEGSHMCWESHIDTDNIKMFASCEDDYINCTQPTTPTIWEDVEEQAVEEGMKNARNGKMMNFEDMACEEDKKEEIYAARKKAPAFALIDKFTNGAAFPVMQPTPCMDKEPIGAMNLEPTHCDFSYKTQDDVSKHDLKKYMDWLCSLRLILAVTTCDFPYDKQSIV